MVGRFWQPSSINDTSIHKDKALTGWKKRMHNITLQCWTTQVIMSLSITFITLFNLKGH